MVAVAAAVVGVDVVAAAGVGVGMCGGCLRLFFAPTQRKGKGRKRSRGHLQAVASFDPHCCCSSCLTISWAILHIGSGTPILLLLPVRQPCNSCRVRCLCWYQRCPFVP